MRILRGAHWVDGMVVYLPVKTRLSERATYLPRFALERPAVDSVVDAADDAVDRQPVVVRRVVGQGDV
ncbi:hypothetical protein HMPREF2826_00005 [Olsenella sp. HMSC062G07]|nr:hypothetical protein HMPREF2826_00005 [Olsenella sp. HMSC062G07]